MTLIARQQRRGGDFLSIVSIITKPSAFFNTSTPDSHNSVKKNAEGVTLSIFFISNSRYYSLRGAIIVFAERKKENACTEKFTQQTITI